MNRWKRGYPRFVLLEANSTVFDLFLVKIVQRETGLHSIKYSPSSITTKQTLTASKFSIDFTFSDFPRHFTGNRNKPALSYRRMKGKTTKY